MSTEVKQNEVILGKQGVSENNGSAYDANYGAHKVGIKANEMVEYYNKWTSYDQDLCPERYHGPMIVSEFTSKHLAGKCHSRILDVGAGSGRVAMELNKYEFNNIDALEPANQLLERSPYKKYYSQCFYVLIGEQTDHLVKDDEYDAIVVAGAFGEGHIPCSGLSDMIRMVKPGGLVIIVMREEYLGYVKEYKNRLVPYMSELENKGKWIQVERTQVQNYSFDKPGLVFVHKVQESGFIPFKSEVLND